MKLVATAADVLKCTRANFTVAHRRALKGTGGGRRRRLARIVGATTTIRTSRTRHHLGERLLHLGQALVVRFILRAQHFQQAVKFVVR